MASSIYAYLKPEVVNAGNEYFDDYFAERPWALIPEEGEELIFVYIKPRFSEKGLTRFIPFMDALREVKDYIHAIHPDDTAEGRELRWTMKRLGYADLISLLNESNDR